VTSQGPAEETSLVPLLLRSKERARRRPAGMPMHPGRGCLLRCVELRRRPGHLGAGSGAGEAELHSRGAAWQILAAKAIRVGGMRDDVARQATSAVGRGELARTLGWRGARPDRVSSVDLVRVAREVDDGACDRRASRSERRHSGRNDRGARVTLECAQGIPNEPHPLVIGGRAIEP
jgi:hypothetical protein